MTIAYIPNVNDQKTLPAGHAQFLSDGNTIPFAAVGDEVPGDVVILDAAHQFIGIVQALKNPTDAAATAGDIIELRVKGLVKVEKADEAWPVGSIVSYIVGDTNFAINATGAHLVVGATDSVTNGDAYGAILINVFNVTTLT